MSEPDDKMPQDDIDELARVSDAADDGRLVSIMTLAQYRVAHQDRPVHVQIQWPTPEVGGASLHPERRTKRRRDR